MKKKSRCRFCENYLKHTFVNLGMSPLCESYITHDQLTQMEPFYPIHAWVCEECFLVQVEEIGTAESIFGGEYAYFSSFSDSWLKHSEAYTEMIVEQLGLGPNNMVIEIASNDGYLLKNFVAKEIPCLGIEPALNIAETAVSEGVPTRVCFFGLETAKELVREGTQADLLIGNNVLAHVPDINDFIAGMQCLLAPEAVITMEFPHLPRLIEENQFDTIYQEHYSYISLFTAIKMFEAHDLIIFDADEIPTHGGSLRIYARHLNNDGLPVQSSIKRILDQELQAGINRVETYLRFSGQVEKTKRKFLEFLVKAKRDGKSIAGYGAAGKGSTFLNYCGVREDFIDFVVDRNTFKQGKFLPGVHIPIFAPEKIMEAKPDYILILPWNLKEEIMSQLADARQWGAKFVVAIPEIQVYE